MDLRNNLQWYWDLSSADASIVDQHSGLSLARVGTTTTDATGGPDGGPCISFGNAAGKYRNASVAKTVSYDDGFSVNIWVRSTGTSSTGNWVINHRDAGIGALLYFQIGARSSGGLDFGSVFDESQTSRAVSNTQAALNTWQMLTLVDTGTAASLYRNGELESTSETSLGDRATGESPFAIGGRAWDASLNFNHRGQLSMAGIWNGPLSESEITALFNVNNGRRYADLNIPSSITARRRRSRGRYAAL